jgi:hypothetical protein
MRGKASVDGKISSCSPKDVYILISRICAYLALYGKRDFEDVAKLRILR